MTTKHYPSKHHPSVSIDKELVNVNGHVGEEANSVGDVLNYSVTIKNTGDVTLTGVSVVDPLTGQNITGVTLAVGQTKVYTSSYAITQADLNGAGNAGSDHDIDNTATVDSDQTSCVTDSTHTPLTFDPKLAVEKQFVNVNGNAGEVANSVGDVLHYTVTVTNTGNVTLTGVSVADPLTGQNVSGVTLAPGASQSFNTTYAITQADLDGAGNAGADHDIDNVATADSNQTTPKDSNSVEVPLFPPQPAQFAFDGEPRPTWSHDHNSDIIWQDFAGGRGDPLMLMGNGEVAAHLVQFSPWPTGELPLWKIAGVGDFNGDGDSEIIWQHDSNDLASLWIMDETDVLTVGQFGSGGQLPAGASPVFSYGPFGFDIKAIGDVNGDGRDDGISQQVNGDVDLWLMDGSYSGEVHAKIGPFASGELAGWHVKGSGDFNGDGNADIIFQHDNGQAAMWLMDANANATFVGAVGPFNPGADWQIKGTGDFNGDGKDDLVWQHTNGQAAMWLMDGTQTTFVGAVGPFNPGANWHIQGTGDFNGDGKSDILWQETGGLVAEWHMDGTNTTFVGAVGMSQSGSPLFTGEFNNGNELDWSVYSKTDSYEAVFGVDAHGNLDGDQLLAVLNQPAQSNASGINLEVPLAKQAVTALLNATNDADGAVTQDFRFSAADVISAVKEVYDDGHFDILQGADLTGLLAFWNAAPAANTGAGAHVAGELHSNDTTTIATSLSFNGDLGGSFDGSIFQVLTALHPDHGWLV
jgi:uncharacterized repeat protein (TIGR01451 family)